MPEKRALARLVVHYPLASLSVALAVVFAGSWFTIPPDPPAGFSVLAVLGGEASVAVGGKRIEVRNNYFPTSEAESAISMDCDAGSREHLRPDDAGRRRTTLGMPEPAVLVFFIEDEGSNICIAHSESRSFDDGRLVVKVTDTNVASANGLGFHEVRLAFETPLAWHEERWFRRVLLALAPTIAAGLGVAASWHFSRRPRT